MSFLKIETNTKMLERTSRKNWEQSKGDLITQKEARG